MHARTCQRCRPEGLIKRRGNVDVPAPPAPTTATAATPNWERMTRAASGGSRCAAAPGALHAACNACAKSPLAMPFSRQAMPWIQGCSCPGLPAVACTHVHEGADAQQHPLCNMRVAAGQGTCQMGENHCMMIAEACPRRAEDGGMVRLNPWYQRLAAASPTTCVPEAHPVPEVHPAVPYMATGGTRAAGHFKASILDRQAASCRALPHVFHVCNECMQAWSQVPRPVY